MQKITPFLWFDDQAEEAAKFYMSIFKHSKIGRVTRYGEAGAQVSGRPRGSVMTVEFQLEGQTFVALLWRSLWVCWSGEGCTCVKSGCAHSFPCEGSIQ